MTVALIRYRINAMTGDTSNEYPDTGNTTAMNGLGSRDRGFQIN